MHFSKPYSTPLVIIFTIICTQATFGQCDVQDFVEDNYTFDAKVLALREIMSNEEDPDYNNPFIEENRYESYIEQLSAIYENPEDNAVIDSLFQEFQFHVVLWQVIPNKITLAIDNEAPWIEDFIDMGVSGVSAIDNLMTTYSFNTVEFFFDTDEKVYVKITSTHEVLNLNPIAEEFTNFPEILAAEPTVVDAPDLNYEGVSYTIPNPPFDSAEYFVERVDIYVEDNQFHFWMGASDCLSGCGVEKEYVVEVDENCNVALLDVPTLQQNKVSIYPNPVQNRLHIEGIQEEIETVSIYSFTGQQVKKLSGEKEVDVSQLTPGAYFVSITQQNGTKSVRKFIKH